MPPKRLVRQRIYAQGDLDGACFLYAIVNAYMALTGKIPFFHDICAAFLNVAHPKDFLSGNTGTTGSYAQNPALLAKTIEAILRGIGDETDRIDIQCVQEQLSARDLRRMINEKSVVLLRYVGDSKYARSFDHWVCAVAYDAQADEARLACSARLQNACSRSRHAYSEIAHNDPPRYSNDALSDKRPHRIVKGEVFILSLAKPA